MRTINAETIAEGHEKVVRLIMTEDANDILTEDKELTFEHPEPVNIHIKHPWKPPFSSPSLQFGEKSLDMYKEEILSPRKLIDRPGLPDFSYLYSNLIFDYPRGDPSIKFDGTGKLIRTEWERGNGKKNGFNQIEYVVDKLVKNPTSRRCVVSLFEPTGHTSMDDPPCLNHIQFLLRNGELNCHALFRSNDMLSAWGANAYALMHLQKFVLDRVKIETNDHFDSRGKITMGWLETTSISAHIYWKRDKHELNEFKKRWI